MLIDESQEKLSPELQSVIEGEVKRLIQVQSCWFAFFTGSLNDVLMLVDVFRTKCLLLQPHSKQNNFCSLFVQSFCIILELF